MLSGNRNFEGRINPQVRANYLASPPLVVAYALAGSIDIDLTTEPLGTGDRRQAGLSCKDIWPIDQRDRRDGRARSPDRKMFQHALCRRVQGPGRSGRQIETVDRPDLSSGIAELDLCRRTRRSSRTCRRSRRRSPTSTRRALLALLGDSITTDHISPAGSIKKDGPAGKYLHEHQVRPADFNSYGSRRGNHEVMMRGTFANTRIKNEMVPGIEGGVTKHLPDGNVDADL